MPTFRSLKTLNAYIKKQINDSLKEEVLEAVKDVELDHISDDVLGAYNPIEYARRDTRGIDDPANIIAAPPRDGILEVENVTQFNPGYGSDNTGYGLVGLIEYGNGWNGYNYEYPHPGGRKPFNKPRPFIQNTKEDLKNNKQHVIALKDGLNKRGIKTK